MSRVICGDALEKLKELPDGCIQTCVTSPPYYGLRDYGTPSQIGLEPTPEEFIARLVAVFHEVKRVLRDDGTLWVNMGDSYAGGNGNGGVGPLSKKQVSNHGSYHGAKIGSGDAKPKDLLGIPWMLAFALRDNGAASPRHMETIGRMINAITESYDTRDQWPDKISAEVERLEREYIDANKGGWYLRNEIIWAKPNPMPESVTDRCTKSHEQIFLLSKSAQYFYDAEAIKEPSVPCDNKPGGDRSARNSFKRGYSSRPAEIVPGNEYNPHRPNRADDNWNIALRNKRDVWTVSTKPYLGAHFATFPRDLIVPCILAGSRPGDVVLDPFGGAGTTAKTAQELGREYITIELNQKYVDEIILPRLAATSVPLPLMTAQVKPVESQAGLL